jgi:type II secretory pathway pseudopilin PulG
MRTTPLTAPRSDVSSGFTIIELLFSMGIVLVVSAGVIDGMMRMAQNNRTLANRSGMNAGVRNALELLQQEVGQAGQVSLSGTVTTTGAIAAGAATVTISSTAAGSATAGMFVGEQLSVDKGAEKEIVTITALTSTQITATFANAHGANTRIETVGAFSSGVVPTTTANGSTGTELKILGDINADGSLLYVEYRCDFDAGRLYRNAMAFDAAAKPDPTVEQVLVANLQPNEGDSDAEQDCFTYHERTVAGTTYVIGVAIALTAQTQNIDATTRLAQTSTRSLLNVSPRNVFNAWQMAGVPRTDYIQPMPAATVLLLAD